MIIRQVCVWAGDLQRNENVMRRCSQESLRGDLAKATDVGGILLELLEPIPYPLAVTDMNLDGKLDIVVSNSNSDDVSILIHR